MRFSTRSKVGGLLSLLAIVTIITAFMFSGLVFRGTATHASNAQYSATPGTLTPAGADNLKKQTTNLLRAAEGFLSSGPWPDLAVVRLGHHGVPLRTSVVLTEI